jgi:CO dehydrogenase/acetyl-CoA synthase beta subunit
MGLFDEQLAEVKRFLSESRREGKVREFRAFSAPAWPAGSSLVLEEDTAIELGNPKTASLSILLWTEAHAIEDGLISLVGPDVGEVQERSLPFAQVLMVRGSVEDEYESYQELRDAVYDTRLSGFMVRTRPSRHSMWCRVAREAVGQGFSLRYLGAAFVKRLKEVTSASSVEVLFVTSSPGDVERLSGAAADARRIIEAMMKMYEEKSFDCEACEYRDVCDEVMELKKMREKLADEKAV